MAFVALAVVGMADAMMTVSRHSIMQLAAPPELRGRVMGTMSVVTRGASPLAEVQSGLLGLGVRPGSGGGRLGHRPGGGERRDRLVEPPPLDVPAQPHDRGLDPEYPLEVLVKDELTLHIGHTVHLADPPGG